MGPANCDSDSGKEELSISLFLLLNIFELQY